MSETLQSVRLTAATARENEVARLDPWFHNLRLPDGIQTAPNHPLGDFPRFKWDEIAPHIPNDLTGCRALDVGCNAGFYTFELAGRGASVDAVDSDPRYLRQARWAADELGLGACVSFREASVYGLADEPEVYDIIWFMGVFYHLRYPLLALDILRRKCRRRLVFQSLSLAGEEEETPLNLAFDDRKQLSRPNWPKMAFVERYLAGDPTNWWVPNLAGAAAMLRSAGMRIVAQAGEDVFICEPTTEDDEHLRRNIEAQFEAVRRA